MKIQTCFVVGREIKFCFSIVTLVTRKRHTYVTLTLSALTSFLRSNLLLNSLETKIFFPLAQQSLLGQGLLIIEASQSHSFRHIIFSRTPLDEWSARRRDLSLKIYTIYNRQTSIPPVGFEPAIPTSERLQTYALDRAASGIGQNPSTDYHNSDAFSVLGK